MIKLKNKYLNTLIINSLIALSLAIFCFLSWFIYFKPTTPPSTLSIINYLPLVNSLFNTASAIAMCLGIRAILKKDTHTHKRYMITALIFSTLFLISYLTYHHFHGDTPFLAQGLVRSLYFFTLISHISLTLFVLPLILITVFYALISDNDKHKKIAKWTFPLWLYVSVTGVLIYLFQVFFN